jgi:hypothetical protein
MAVTGGGVDIDSAPGLHLWMKNLHGYQENEEWDLNPVLGLLFHDPATQRNDVLIAEFWDTMGVKPYEFLRMIAAALLKVSKEHQIKGAPVAASFFCEGWGYSISPKEVEGFDLDQSLLPADWKERADYRLEAKTVVTLAVDNPSRSIFAVRMRGKTEWDEDQVQDHDEGMVAASMRSLARFLARRTREEKTANNNN